MNLSIVNTLPEDAWRQFVAEQPGGNIFHTPEVFQAFSRTKGYKPQLWAAVQNDEILALMVPVQIMLIKGILKTFTTRAVVYGSPLWVPGDRGREALSILLQTYTRNVQGKPIFTEIRNTFEQQEIQPTLRDCGFNFEGHLNYLIDLEHTEEEIWHNLSKKTRQHIHKARESGLKIEEMHDTKDLATAYRLLVKVYNRVNVPLVDFSLFSAAFDVLMPRGMIKAFIVKREEQCIGFNAILLYKDRIYDWYRASEREFSACQPESMLVWQIVQWGRQNHYHVFDFGGAGKPNHPYGPRIFKSRWGGTLVNYGRNTFVHSRTRLAISRIGFQLTRLFMFRKPVSGKDW